MLFFRKKSYLRHFINNQIEKYILNSDMQICNIHPSTKINESTQYT